MTEQTKNFIIRCVEDKRGDDYVRAKLDFKNYTPKQMKEQHGQSGRTRQEILDNYKQFNDKIDESIREIKEIPTT